MTITHPAKFSDPVLAAIAPFIQKGVLYLDPFAGTGKIHALCDNKGAYSIGLEIEPEWASMHPRTLVADALHMPFPRHSIGGAASSPTYANRMADHHNATDSSRRMTYRHTLGRPLHPNNSGQLQWGPQYKQFHIFAFAELLRVLEPGAEVLWNVSNHIRQGVEQLVTEWHRDAAVEMGFKYEGRIHVETQRLGYGANHDVRCHGESVLVLQTPLRSRRAGDTLRISRTTPLTGDLLEGKSMTDTSVAEATTEASEPDSESTEPTTDASASTDTDEEAAEDKSRRGRGFLETDVKSVTDKFVTGTVKLADGELLTPHRIARLIKEHDGLDKPPSTGAVANILDAWAEIGFASINEKPKAFLDYTETGREEGLTALKTAASDAKKAARKAAKEAEKAAAAPAAESSTTDSE